MNRKSNGRKRKKKEHKPVLLKEVLELLITKEFGIYIDCTFGLGGHSRSILKQLKDGQLIAMDWDKEETELAFQDKTFICPNFTLINDNFINLSKHLKKLKIKEVDGILLDLGLSSYQIECLHYGLSFRNQAPLNMKISCSDDNLNAEKIVNNYSADQLTNIFRTYGEEKLASRIAKKIVQRRKIKPITDTQQLVGIIASCFETKTKKHPARKVFQALRIYLNKELDNLTTVLKVAFEHLAIKGRIIVISYNSLEDRIVKKTFKNYNETKKFVILNKKVIIPKKEEIKENNRSRSAKMRVIERII